MRKRGGCHHSDQAIGIIQCRDFAVGAHAGIGDGACTPGRRLITRQWPDAERLEDLAIPSFNFGADGDESGNVLYRLAFTTAPLNFRSIVILIGTNQLRAHPACGVAAGVASVVKALRERAPTASMVVVSILPRRALANEVREANELLAAGSGYKYADAWTPFVARCPNVDVECALLTDGIHLTREGYRVLGAAVRKAL